MHRITVIVFTQLKISKGYIMLLSHACIFATLLLSFTAFGNAQLDQFPGAIPLDHSRGVSTDLITEEGQRIYPSQAKQYRENIARVLENGDLSYVNPETTTLWDPNNEHPLKYQPIKLDPSKGAKFVDNYPTWIKSIMFEAKQDGQSYLFFASKKAHNLLLRKAIAEKLGYRIPDIQWVPNIEIEFPTLSDKKVFIQKFGRGAVNDEGVVINPGQYAGDSNLWIVENEEDSTKIKIQDIMVMNINEAIYNLALGNFDAEANVIKGRRTFNSLLVPFAMVDIPESLNLFSPKFGREFSGYAIFDYQFAEGFYPTYEDARWIARRILNLSNKDFGDIAAAAKYPHEETLLLTALLKARRDDLGRMFKIDIKPMNPKLDVSYGDRLKDGKLIPRFEREPEHDEDLPDAIPQPGYATRTAYGEQKSPLTRSEIFGFFKSIFQTNIISNLVTEFNAEILPQANVAKGIQEHQIDNAVEQWAHFIKTGEVKEIEFGAYTVPSWGFDLIANRAVVVGQYLGSDENIQLADTIGFSVDAGAYIGFDGIDPPYFLSGGAKVYLNRKYTHLKPIVSIKESLKTPFRNMIVPWFQNDLAQIFNEIESGNTEYLATEEGFKKVKEMTELFKETFQDGESLIVSDSLGAGLSLRGGYNFTEILKLQAEFNANQLTLWRTNIVRKGDEIQIYKDFGLLGSIGIKISLNASFIPIVSMSFKKSKGYARTSFNSVSMVLDETNKLDTVNNIVALKHLIHDNSVEEVNMLKKPFKITHKFDESTCNFQFFFWHSKCLTAKDDIKVVYPEGYKRRYYRYLDGDRSGRDYQSLFKDVVNSLINEFTDSTYAFNAVTSGNPGDTFMGRSTTEQFSFETELESGYPVDMFASILHVKKGWQADKEKSKELFQELNDLYDYEFFPKKILSRTEKIQLYNITLQINFYEDALFNIMEQDRKSFEKLSRLHVDLDRVNSYHNNGFDDDDDLDHYDVSRMIESYRKGMVEAWNDKDHKKFAKKLNKFMSFASKAFSMEGLKALAGGEYNLFARGQVGGFRKGDEDGDVPYVTDTYGKMGSSSFNGPLQGLKNDINISESELFVRWIMGYL
jgi:hypothetical protein